MRSFGASVLRDPPKALRLFVVRLRNHHWRNDDEIPPGIAGSYPVLLNLLAGCAASPNQLKGTVNNEGAVAGFWIGVWQGFIAPFVFVVSLFKDNLNIYEVHNNGGWYNFGYLFGLACFFGGGGGGAARRKRMP
jgi:hypothetical protein